MATPATSELTDHLGYWLRLLSNHVSLSFARRLEARSVSLAEWVMLRQLYDEPALAPSRLAERMGMTRGAITKLADRLIARALVRRAADPSDGRAQTLSLTPWGRVLTPELAAMADHNDTEMFGALPPADRAALSRMLRALVDSHGLKGAPVE